MTRRLFSKARGRKSYRPCGYTTRTALDNETPVEEDIGPVADEFEGDLTNDPLEDVDDTSWAVIPGTEEDDREDDLLREETITNTSSRKRTANEPYSVYHGTSSSAAEKVRNEGLKPPPGMGAGWFMLTDSYDQAARYAPADQDPVVMEFSVSDSDIYSRGNKGSVLWQATPHSAYGFDANAYAVRGDSLPSSYLKGVHPVAGEKTSSRRVAEEKEEAPAGNLYRGLSSDFLTDDEYNQIVEWSNRNEFDPDNFTMAEPNYEMIYPILERLEGQDGIGRHWSTDYDVASSFARQNAWHNESDGERGQFGIVFRGDWAGEGQDMAESQPGFDGVMRPSNLPEEKEVTLHPNSEVNLLGMEVFEPGGFNYDIPVPDIKVRAYIRDNERKKATMRAINGYLRYANHRGLDPKESRTSRAYRRANKNLSPKSMVEISHWMRAQKTAHQTARQVLATTRGYRRKLSSSWHLDTKLGAYISTVQQKFACSCGAKLDVPAYNMCKCGKVWNAYKVHSATKGDTMYVVREVPVRENVLVASKGGPNKTARRRNSRRKRSYNPGEEVFYYNENGIDPTVVGIVDSYPAVDPDGGVHDDLVELRWLYRDGDSMEIVDTENLVPAGPIRSSRRRHADFLHQDVFDAFEEFLMQNGFDPNGEAPQGDIDRAIDAFEAEYGNQYGLEALKNTYMYHEGSRRPRRRSSSRRKTAGAEDFAAFAEGSSAAEAFKNARQEALAAYGNSGYTGSIAEKTEYAMASNRPLSDEEAKAVIGEAFEGGGRFDDKWGPAGCIQLSTGGYVFFGVASS